MNLFEQGLLTYLSEEQMQKIRSVHIGIAGAGGLGSNCAFNLVRCGFKRFTMCDYDRVEPSNLNRQFYFMDQIGLPKVEALKANLLRINPDLSVTALCERITKRNAMELVGGCDVIVEAFDGAVDKKMIAEIFARSGRYFVSASGLAGWGNSDEIKVRKIHATFSLVGDGRSAVAAQLPPCSPRVNITAAKQADCVLEWVLHQ